LTVAGKKRLAIAATVISASISINRSVTVTIVTAERRPCFLAMILILSTSPPTIEGIHRLANNPAAWANSASLTLSEIPEACNSSLHLYDEMTWPISTQIITNTQFDQAMEDIILISLSTGSTTANIARMPIVTLMRNQSFQSFSLSIMLFRDSMGRQPENV